MGLMLFHLLNRPSRVPTLFQGSFDVLLLVLPVCLFSDDGVTTVQQGADYTKLLVESVVGVEGEVLVMIMISDCEDQTVNNNHVSTWLC